MGLIMLNRGSEMAQIESRYEGLIPVPPFAGPGEIAIGRIPGPRYISLRTVGAPGNIVLELNSANPLSRAGQFRYFIRDGEVIRLNGDVDYDATVHQIPNGAVSATGVLIAELLASPISSGEVIVQWGSDMAPLVWPPSDQGAIFPAFRCDNLNNAATITSNEMIVPASGRVSWIADYTAGMAGNLELRQGGIVQIAALAAFGTWSFPDLIAGQYAQVSIRNTGNAGGINVDLKVVRT